MKKLFIVLIMMLFVASQSTQAQLAKDSWSLGFGFKYPRFVSINTTPLNSNYGGFVSLQRNFSEHVGVRFKVGYNHLESEFTSAALTLQTTTTNSITGDLDVLFYLAPCEPVSPYLFGGFGGNYRMLSNYFTTTYNENAFVMQYGFGAGIDWNLDEEWKLITEFGYHIANNTELDGTLGGGEVNGRDTYMGISLGLQYFFEKGEPSKYCELYSGIKQEFKDMTDYNRIEEMIKAHIPKEITKEIVVEKPAKPVAPEKWVLVGVNFASASAKFNAESYPILYDAAKTLLKNPEMKVEVQGYTDNIGADTYNKKLAQKRADAVKQYLTSKGIAANRITAVGYGESNPIADNTTADGRAMNRRIEFKMQ